eukprot:3678550-Rhodomonas_salina.3
MSTLPMHSAARPTPSSARSSPRPAPLAAHRCSASARAAHSPRQYRTPQHTRTTAGSSIAYVRPACRIARAAKSVPHTAWYNAGSSMACASTAHHTAKARAASKRS